MYTLETFLKFLGFYYHTNEEFIVHKTIYLKMNTTSFCHMVEVIRPQISEWKLLN